MTLREFSLQCGISENQIRKRYKEIGGVEYIDGEWIIPNGTRYPAKRLHHVDSFEEKVYALLKATSEYRYIDSKILHIPDESFNVIISVLLQQGWIQTNGIENPYGANHYDLTLIGANIINQRRYKSIEAISAMIARCAGDFTGRLINQMNK